MKEEELNIKMSDIYIEFGIDIHFVPTHLQSQINNLIKAFILMKVKPKRILDMLQNEVKKIKEGKPPYKLNEFDQGFNEGLIHAKQKVSFLVQKLERNEKL